MATVFKSVGYGSVTKNYCLVGLLSVSKVFEKFVNNNSVSHLEKSDVFSGFQHDFRFSQSTADLLTVIFDEIVMAFNRPGATRHFQVFQQSMACWSSSKTQFLQNFRSSIWPHFVFSNRQLHVVLDGKSSPKYPVNDEVPQESILGPTLFLLYIDNLPDDLI